MAKRVQEANIGTRAARQKLAPRHKPYFRAILEGLQLGYRRSTVKGRPGSWLVRRYLGAGRYETEALGLADDLPDVDLPADGRRVLTADQAQAAAREWARDRQQAAMDQEREATTPTVRAAVEAYIAARTQRSAKTGRDAELRLSHHVLDAPLAEKNLATLKPADLATWRDGLRRGGRGADGTGHLAPATLARLLNDLRAALGAAARKARLSGEVLFTIQEGLRAPEAPTRAREKMHLSDDDVRSLVEAALAEDADFGALVLVLAATGCRFDQAARLTVADLQASNRRIMVPTSAKGRGEKQTTHTAIPLPDDVLARLRPLVAGRRGAERLLLRWHHEQAPGEKATGKLPAWVATERRPWRVSAEMSRAWRAMLATAELPLDVVPYALRHSSIIRALRAGLPVRLVAAAHDTSVAMIERHYGAFIVDAAEDLLRRAAVPLAPPAPAEVVNLDGRRRA